MSCSASQRSAARTLAWSVLSRSGHSRPAVSAGSACSASAANRSAWARRGGVELARLGQPLAAELANRLEHREARLAIALDLAHEAVIDQSADAVEQIHLERTGGTDHWLGIVEPPAADEDRRSA